MGRKYLAAIAALGLSLCLRVQGAPLLVGGAFVTPGEPDPTGGILQSGSGIPNAFSAGGPAGFSGTLTCNVYKDDPSNPFAGIGDPNPLHHGLTFTYTLHSNAGSVTSLERLVTTDFSGFQTDVSYQAPATGQIPSSTDRSFGPGAVIGWSFTGAPAGLGRLAPGATSATLVIQTDAPAYDITQTASVIDGSLALVPSIGPSIAFIGPEPSSLFLVALGGMALAGRRRSTGRVSGAK
jgi:hypothetical protein